MALYSYGLYRYGLYRSWLHIEPEEPERQRLSEQVAIFVRAFSKNRGGALHQIQSWRMWVGFAVFRISELYSYGPYSYGPAVFCIWELYSYGPYTYGPAVFRISEFFSWAQLFGCCDLYSIARPDPGRWDVRQRAQWKAR